MRVVAFAPALIATEDEGGGVSAGGFPMTSCYVNAFPAEITISVVIAVCGLRGEEYDPVRYLIANGPDGERSSAMRFNWHWDDNPETPVKFRVFVQQLPIWVGSEGTYSLGLYTHLEGTQPEQTFPLQVLLSPHVRG
ncbi:MAG: hypothetical protein KIH64_001555 [Mycobacterium sp.]|nr:hypothetical protein [Mycobacterium sp.]